VENFILSKISESIAVKSQLAKEKYLLQNMQKAAMKMIQTFQNGGKVLFCGNGGSAADAQHLAAELSGRFYFDRDPLFAEALHVNSSYLTAVANDYSYDEVYARLIKGIGVKGDILVGISTSGNSKNIMRAFQECKKLGVSTIALTGHTGGQMKAETDLLINVPSTDTPRIQETHILIGHIICEIVERELFIDK
jgi:D-sedoheptulose 7-phosphate isomerase